MHHSDAVTRIEGKKKRKIKERKQTGKETIRVASEEVFRKFKTLINGARYGHG